MNRRPMSLGACALAVAVMTHPAVAQEPQTAPEPKAAVRVTPTPAPALVPLEVQVVFARYQGEKRVSSLPYTISVNANEPGGNGTSRLRMGARVPVPTLAAPKGNPAGPSGPLPGPVNYQDIGTNIDCSARSLDDGRFQVLISVEDSSVITSLQDQSTPTVGDMPVFRSFKSTNTLVLRDGQTRQFTVASDRVSGEIVKIDVSLKVVK